MTRSEASRINGAKSQGPVTPEGKANSSQNNYRHGYYAKRTVVLRSESRESYEENKEAYMQLFKPRNTVEAECVTDLVNVWWKLRRIEKDTVNLLDKRRLQAKDQQDTVVTNLHPSMTESLAYESMCAEAQHTLVMLGRAENSCHLAIGRSLRNLEKARKLVDPENNPPLDEILAATRLTIVPRQSADATPEPTPEPPPTPHQEPDTEKSRYEPKPTPENSDQKANNFLQILTILLAILLWTVTPAISHPNPHPAVPPTATTQAPTHPTVPPPIRKEW